MSLLSRYLLNGGTQDSISHRDASASGVVWIPGKFRQAANMNNGTITIPSPSTLRYSYAFWVRLNSSTLGEYRKFMEKRTGSNHRTPGFWFGSWNDRLHLRQALTESPNAGIDTGSVELTIGQWHHVIFTCDPQVDGNTYFKTYLDGSLVASSQDAGLPLLSDSDTTFLPEDYALGDVRLYDHALTSAEATSVALGRTTHLTLSGKSHDLEDHVSVLVDNAAYEHDEILNRKVAVFDGASYIRIERSLGQKDADQVWTVEALIYRMDLSGQQWLVRGMNRGVKISHVDVNRKPLMYLNDGSNDYYVYGAAGSMPAGEWIHVVYAFDNASGYRGIYVNGKDVSLQPGQNHTSTPYGLTETFDVGDQFKGKMAYLKIYATALTPEQVKTRYQARMSFDAKGNLRVGDTRFLESGQKSAAIIDYSVWKDDGSVGAVGKFSTNGADSESNRVLDTGPFGEQSVVFQAVNKDTSSHADGGWNSHQYPIDNTKKYRHSVWVRRKVPGNGHGYWGLHGYGSVDGVLNVGSLTNNLNPYFFSNDLSHSEWRLYVGYVHPHTHTGGNDPTNGAYLADGTRLSGLIDYVWRPESVRANHRAYLYYSTNVGTTLQFAHPRIDVCDGTEPSLDQLFKGAGLLWSQNNFPKPLEVNSTLVSLGGVSELGVTRDLLHLYRFTKDCRDSVSPRVGVPSSSPIGPEGIIFTGTGEVDLGTLSAFGDEWSVMCRFRPTSFSDYNHLLTAYSQNEFGFKVSRDSRPYWTSIPTGSMMFNTGLTIGQSYHLALTYKDGVLRQYVDGIFDNSHSVTIATIPSRKYRVGRFAEELSNGVERDLRVYRRALSANEIAWQARWSSGDTTIQRTNEGTLLTGEVCEMD